MNKYNAGILMFIHGYRFKHIHTTLQNETFIQMILQNSYYKIEKQFMYIFCMPELGQPAITFFIPITSDSFAALLIVSLRHQM